MMRGRLRRFRREERGAAALEFALIAVPLLMFTFGLIEFGRALFMQQSLAYATDRAARVLYITPETDQAAITQIVRNNLFLADPNRLTVVLCDPQVQSCNLSGVPSVVGARIKKLEVAYDFRTVVPNVIDRLIAMKFNRVIILPED